MHDVRAAVAFYRERLGFDSPHETDGFAVMTRDDAVIHLWGSSWRAREDFIARPIRSGAESFLAGTAASCRIELEDVDALYAELQAAVTDCYPPFSLRP